MEVWTRRAAALWATLALLAFAWRVPGRPALLEVTALALAVSALLAWRDRRWAGIPLLATCLLPAAIRLITGRYHIYDVAPWFGALLGPVVVDAVRAPWRVSRGRAALVLWTLVVAAAGTVAVLREYDFNAMLHVGGSAAPVVRAIAPQFPALWSLYVTLVTVIGLLWFDGLHAWPLEGLRRYVLTPLAMSAAVMVLVACYQTLIDVDFLSGGVYAVKGRAAGTIWDANVCGTIAAVWIGGMAALYRRHRRLVFGSALLALIAIWGTGSKTATLAALVTVGGAAMTLAAAERPSRSWMRWARPLAAVAALLVVVGVVASIAPSSVIGPVQRFRYVLPRERSGAALAMFARQMWDRGGYGTAAVAMVRAYPATGVGPGGFNTMAGEFRRRGGEFGGGGGGDNAQNWYRQQLAELGVLGSLGWVLFLASIAWTLLPRRTDVPERIALRTAILAFAAVSLVGIPGQDPAVVITVASLVGFYQLTDTSTPAPRSIGAVRWAAIGVVLVAFLAVTWQEAHGPLRPARRAVRRHDPYNYGIYYAEPDAAGREWRWVEGRAVTIVAGEASWIELTIRIPHRDVGERPVDVRAALDGTRVIDTRVATAEAVTVFVRRRGDAPLVLDTWVSRVVRPADVGVQDPRTLGAQVSWRFVDAPAPNAPVVRLR